MTEEWQAREGEPAFEVTIAQAGTEMAVILRAGVGPMWQQVVLRPAVAVWLAEQLDKSGRQARSGLVIPNNGSKVVGLQPGIPGGESAS